MTIRYAFSLSVGWYDLAVLANRSLLSGKRRLQISFLPMEMTVKCSWKVSCMMFSKRMLKRTGDRMHPWLSCESKLLSGCPAVLLSFILPSSTSMTWTRSSCMLNYSTTCHSPLWQKHLSLCVCNCFDPNYSYLCACFARSVESIPSCLISCLPSRDRTMYCLVRLRAYNPELLPTTQPSTSSPHSPRSVMPRVGCPVISRSFRASRTCASLFIITIEWCDVATVALVAMFSTSHGGLVHDQYVITNSD